MNREGRNESSSGGGDDRAVPAARVAAQGVRMPDADVARANLVRRVCQAGGAARRRHAAAAAAAPPACAVRGDPEGGGVASAAAAASRLPDPAPAAGQEGEAPP